MAISVIIHLLKEEETIHGTLAHLRSQKPEDYRIRRGSSDRTAEPPTTGYDAMLYGVAVLCERLQITYAKLETR